MSEKVTLVGTQLENSIIPTIGAIFALFGAFKLIQGIAKSVVDEEKLRPALNVPTAEAEKDDA